MRVAVVGFGGWGRIHAAAVQELAQHELIAIACRTDASAAAARSEYPGVEVVTDYRVAVDNPAVEAVHVVTPSYLHVPVAIDALRAGKHVLLEKPMAASLSEAERLVEEAKSAESTVTVVHELRCSHQWSALRAAVEQGRIGTPQYAMFNLFRFPYRSGADGWRYDRDKVGSWVLEEPIHFFDLLLWYFEDAGKPLSVHGFTREHTEGLSRDFTAVVRFESGAYGVVSQTLSAFEHHQVVEVVGTDGAVRSLWSGAMDRTDKPEFSVTIQQGREGTPEPVSFDAPSGELFEIKRYIDDALQGFSRGESLYSLEKEFTLMKICLAAEESARTGRPVALS